MLLHSKLLVWKESAMPLKKAIEALNRTLQDLRDTTDIMERMIVLLAGDFRKTLPIIQRGTPADEIRACIKSSSFWAKAEKFSLKTNMRVHLRNDVDSEHYAETQLKIGDGCLDADAGGYNLLSREICKLVKNNVDLQWSSPWGRFLLI
ncbi:ATP-dependent DNA helicase [Trichonephila clavipes]|nr:ATP-dependent DNA helicase [Trichonephila clavipes]